ncbi:hypothetical protein CLOBOL_05993 [Enterocloster bolteae ATCC BAA-613]|uniref:Uncharacterized protein n=1 Tax=Enterocloster bolteae (strain ATCC BAA-613 / DSM 15670 / CCUG 46953 / JCM 12243 / WAL 16351) TaxID=411902 RepID=A8S281_ENTBW|nr:hypothetical protein CLOBOL_05993 [Enterocloster bolteae ATCC BAA-613]
MCNNIQLTGFTNRALPGQDGGWFYLLTGLAGLRILRKRERIK